jgi:hypothetical protein
LPGGVIGQTQHSVPATELTPDAAFERWCTQHGMQAVPSAAVLLLQLLVTQARSQIQASIARTWDSLYETRTDGQLSDTEKVRELEKHGVGMETELKSGTNVIVRTSKNNNAVYSQWPYGGAPRCRHQQVKSG